MSVSRRFFRGTSSRQAVPYPDPYVDVAQFNIPPSIKSTMILCRRLFLTHSTIYPTIWKYATYPITDIVVEAATENIKKDWTHVFNDVYFLKEFIQEMGLDYFCYGNAMCAVVFPFDKYLICPEQNCGYEQKARDAQYRFCSTGQWDYRGDCPACKKRIIFKVEDREVKRAYGRLKLMRFPPLTMDIDYNPYTGDTEYYHRIPRIMRDKLQHGSRLLAATLPKEFILAAKTGKRIRIERDNFFHMKRPSISDSRLSFSPWGLPLPLPIIKDAFMMQVLKKANEAMAFNRINPLRVLFPMEGNQAVFAGHNLALVRSRLEGEVRKWIRDPNYIAIVPSQVGSVTVGADARPMLLEQEIRAYAENIVAGMTVPREFIYGGLSYSGSNVSIRMIENDMMNYRGSINRLIAFVQRRTQTYLNWPDGKGKLSSLRMADDIQLKQFAANLHAAGKLSDDTFMTELGFSHETERKKKRTEFEHELEMMTLQAQASAQSQGEGLLITSKYQFEAQQRMAEMQIKADAKQGQPQQGVTMNPGAAAEPTDGEVVAGQMDGSNGGIPLAGMLDQHMRELQGMDPSKRQQMLAQVQKSNPAYAYALRKQMGASGTLDQPDVRPMPTQLPPRRGNPPV